MPVGAQNSLQDIATVRCTLWSLFIVCPLAIAQAGPAAESSAGLPLKLTGTLRVAIASSNRLLDDSARSVPVSYTLRASQALASDVRVHFDGQVGNQAQAGVDKLGIVREAYVEWRPAAAIVSVGRQKIGWGRADSINPTDVFGVRQYTRMVAEDDEQRVGVDALRARYALGLGSLEGVVEAGFRPSVIPLPVRPDVSYDRSPGNVNGNNAALRYSFDSGAIDGALTYYDGLDRLPDLVPVGRVGNQVVVGMRYPKMRLLGVDFASTGYGLVWRGEAAYQRQTNHARSDPFSRHDSVTALLGIERTFAYDVSAYLQAFGKYVLDFQRVDGGPQTALILSGRAVVDQVSESRVGLTFKLSKRWSDAWTSEISLLAAWPQRDSIWRPRIIYRPDDRWRWILSSDQFRGPQVSTFGQLRSNSHVTLSLEMLH